MGVLAVSGVSNDFRDVELKADEGDERCKLALEMFEYQVAQYIASFAAAMGGGGDCIVFTAGIGENNTVLREHVIGQLAFLGAKIDVEKNKTRGKELDVTGEGSKVKVFAIPTNEEYMIALDTERLASALK